MSASAFIHCLHKPTASLAGNAKGNISDHIPLSNLQDIIYLENTSKLVATNANDNPYLKKNLISLTYWSVLGVAPVTRMANA